MDLIEYRQWLVELGRAESTITAYTREIRRVEKWLQAHGASLRTATEELMKAWRTALRVGPSAVRAYVAAVRSYYRWAVRSHRVEADPTRDVPIPPEPPGLPRPMPESLLVEALVNAPKRVKPWLALAALAGLRACEIAVLRREDIIEGPASRVLVVHGKGGKKRIVPVSDQLWTILVEHGLPASGYLFKRADGRPGPNSRAVISNVANSYLHSIGIHETLHQIRHRFGTQAYGVHKDLRVVQELMGHASPQTTARYADFCRTEAITTVAGVQIDLSTREPRELARNPAGGEIDRPPQSPVSTSTDQGEPPVLLSASQFAIRALELAPQDAPRTDYHQVWQPGRVAPRVRVVKRQQAKPLYLSLHLPQELSFRHLCAPRARPSPPPAWPAGRL